MFFFLVGWWRFFWEAEASRRGDEGIQDVFFFGTQFQTALLRETWKGTKLAKKLGGITDLEPVMKANFPSFLEAVWSSKTSNHLNNFNDPVK